MEEEILFVVLAIFISINAFCVSVSIIGRLIGALVVFSPIMPDLFDAHHFSIAYWRDSIHWIDGNEKIWQIERYSMAEGRPSSVRWTSPKNFDVTCSNAAGKRIIRANLSLSLNLNCVLWCVPHVLYVWARALNEIIARHCQYLPARDFNAIVFPTIES